MGGLPPSFSAIRFKTINKTKVEMNKAQTTKKRMYANATIY
jgi:hypothetical protein